MGIASDSIDRFNKQYNELVRANDIKIRDIRIKELENKVTELEKKLENAIVPKFVVGQEVFYLGKNSIESYIVDHIEGLYFRYCDKNDTYLYEEDLFATKEEAEQKLAELLKKE